MKKNLTLLALICSVCAGFGQGRLTWNNSALTQIQWDNIADASAPILLPANTGPGSNPYLFGLFVAPSGTPAPASSALDPSVGAHDPNWQFVAG